MSSFLTTAEIRSILKKAGFKANQVSVKAPHGNQYVTVTVRDAEVKVSAVENALKGTNTWNMDQTDYVTGQSVHVEISREVRTIHAASVADKVIKATTALGALVSDPEKFNQGVEIEGTPFYMFMAADFGSEKRIFMSNLNGIRSQEQFAHLGNLKDYELLSIGAALYCLLNQA